MSQIVLDAIAAQVDELERVVDIPEPPFGYGTDLSAVQDIDENAAEVDPFSRLALAQALVRRLITSRGSLRDDLGYGLDLRAEVNVGRTRADVIALAGQVRSEVEKDDRVTTASVTVIPSPNGSRLEIRIVVQPEDPQLGRFDLTLAATSKEVILEAIS